MIEESASDSADDVQIRCVRYVTLRCHSLSMVLGVWETASRACNSYLGVMRPMRPDHDNMI